MLRLRRILGDSLGQSRQRQLVATIGLGSLLAALSVGAYFAAFAGGGSTDEVVTETFVPDRGELPFVLRHPSGAVLTILKAAPEAMDAPATARIELEPQGAGDIALPEGVTTAGDVYSFAVSGLRSGEFRIELPYHKSAVPEGITEERIAVASREDGPWGIVPVESVKVKEGIVAIRTERLSLWQSIIFPGACPRLPDRAGGLTCVKVTKVEDGDTVCVEWPGEPPRDQPALGPPQQASEGPCTEQTPDIKDWPVRLIGIDTPELTRRLADGTYQSDPQCYSVKAKERTQSMVEGRSVWLELDPAETLDALGRILGYLWDGPQFVNERLVRDGFARERHWFPDIGPVRTHEYKELLSAAGDQARESQEGLWDACVEVAYQCHIASDGWLNWFWNGETCGTTGKARQMEAVRLWVQASGFDIEYRTHVAFEGWQNWIKSGEIAGTVGQGLKIEAVEIRLVGAPQGTHVEYRAHVAGLGWRDWTRDGGTAGTIGEGRPVEALEVRMIAGTLADVVETPTPTPPPTAPPTPPPTRKPCPAGVDSTFCDFVYEMDSAFARGDVAFVIARTTFEQHTCGEFAHLEGPPLTGFPPSACKEQPPDTVVVCIDWTFVGGAHPYYTCLTEQEYAQRLTSVPYTPTESSSNVHIIGVSFTCAASGCQGDLLLRDPTKPISGNPQYDSGVRLTGVQTDIGWVLGSGFCCGAFYGGYPEYAWPP